MLVLVHRQKDERGRQAAFADLARDGKAVLDRHRDVEHRDGDVSVLAGVRAPDRRPTLRQRRVNSRCASMIRRKPWRKIG